MKSNTEFNRLKLKTDQLYLPLSGGKVNGETIFTDKVTFGTGKKTIKIHDGIIEGLDFPEGHTYDLELDGTQLTLTEDSEDKTTVQIPSSLLGTCTTAAATAAKVVTLSDATGWELKQGASVAVKFSNTNTFSATAQAPVTLNVNNTGAKNIYYGGSAHPTGTNTTAFGRANYINIYVYDGTYWVWAGSSSDNNTTYSAMSQSEANTGTATTARTITAAVLKQAIQTHSPSDAYDITHGQSNVGNDLDALQEAVADSDDAYSPSKAYDVGERCIYNNVLYKCVTACSAAEWSVNQNCFSATTLTSTVTDLYNDLGGFKILFCGFIWPNGPNQSTPLLTGGANTPYLVISENSAGANIYVASTVYSYHRFKIASAGTPAAAEAEVNINDTQIVVTNRSSQALIESITIIYFGWSV